MVDLSLVVKKGMAIPAGSVPAQSTVAALAPFIPVQVVDRNTKQKRMRSDTISARQRHNVASLRRLIVAVPRWHRQSGSLDASRGHEARVAVGLQMRGKR